LHIGAIVTVAGPNHDGPGIPVHQASDFIHHKLSEIPLAYWPVLGKSILDRVVDNLCSSGVRQVSVIPENGEPHSSSKVEAITRHQGSFWASWETIVSNYLHQGIETLLLIRLGHYAEIDITNFLRYHRENGHSLTQACGEHSPLDIVAVDASALNNGDPLRSRLSQLISSRQRYQFRGYSNELKRPEQFRQLVVDALAGACAIRPLGREVEPGFWLGEGARVDGSSCVVGPTYIGAGVRVRNACTISGYSSIEQQCEVDCGTAVDSCSIFPATYVGMALNLKNAIVSGSHLFHLQRNVEVEIQDRRLIGARFASHRLVKNARTYLGGKARKLSTTVLSTRSSRLASLLTSRSSETFGGCQDVRRTRAEEQSPVILGEVEQ
jgi:NDP-sugar pyrophosphorylase family protein